MDDDAGVVGNYRFASGAPVWCCCVVLLVCVIGWEWASICVCTLVDSALTVVPTLCRKNHLGVVLQGWFFALPKGCLGLQMILRM